MSGFQISTGDGYNVVVKRDENQGAYIFGIEESGVFISFGARKLGGIDSQLAQAKEAAAEQASAQPAEQPAPDEPPAPGEQPAPGPPAP